MTRAKRSPLIVALSVVFLVSALSNVRGQAPEYEVQFLGVASSIRAINNVGDCVGYYLPPVSGGYERAWVSIDGAALELLPLPAGMSSSTARDINDLGQIVGSVGVNFTSEVSYAATWIPNGSGGYTIELLGTLPGFDYSLATAINNLGDIVGYATFPFIGGGSPLYFDPAGNVSLFDVYGFDYSCWDINDARQVVGEFDLLDLDTGVVEELPIQARAINENGQTAGRLVHGFVSPTSYDAVRYTPGIGVEIVTIDPTSATSAYAINDNGDVAFEWGAAVYLDGVGSFALTTLLSPTSSQWQIDDLNWDIDINNGRQVAAMALNTATGTYGAVRLSPNNPTPEFIRGEVNGDGAFDIADVVTTLNHLFITASAGCLDAADSNDDDDVDIADAVYTLQALFTSGSVPPAPFPNCGVDTTPGGLGCLAPTCP